MRHHPNQYLQKLALPALVSIALSAMGRPQELQVYFENSGAGFGHYEQAPSEMRIAIVEPIAVGTASTRNVLDGSPTKVVVQELRVISGQTGAPETLQCVVGYSPFRKLELPLGTRCLLIYRVPIGGKAWLSTYTEATLGPGEVAGDRAIPTDAARLATGRNFEEVVFGSMLESVMNGHHSTMTDLMERLAHPPGMCFSTRGVFSDRVMTEYLVQVSQKAAAKGGMYNVAFHTLLGRWHIRGSGQFLLDAILANLQDARMEDVLSWRPPGIWEVGANRKYDLDENQARLLEGAKTTVSDQAAAILVTRLHNPMRDSREEFLGLLRREMPKLRAQICNILAVEFDKRERMLPFTKDKEGWEQRVAEMSQTWLRELGMDGT